MRRVAVAVLGLMILTAAVAWARPGDRDPTFDGDGIAEDIGAASRFADIAALPGGDVVAVGRSVGAGTFALPPAIAVRFRPDGTLRAPVRRLEVFGTAAAGAGVAVDSQGRVLVVVDNGAGRVALTRLTGDTLATDTTYGRDGVSSTGTIDPDAAEVIGLGITPDDRPVVVATHFDGGAFTTTILRWDASGVLDPSFGTGGRIVLADNRVASDMLVDAGGRTVLARPAGSVLRITDSAPGTAFAVPAAVRTPGMQVALSGSDLVVAGADDAGADTEVRLVKLSDAGVLDAAFGTRTATVPGQEPTSFRDLLALGDGKLAATLGLRPAASGAPTKLGLVRFNADGTPDATFDTGSGDHYALDDLGAPARSAFPQAGLLPGPDGKLLVAGRTALPGDDGTGDRAFVARYGAPGLPPSASLTRSYRPIGDPPAVRAFARPGQPVDFTASGSDPDGAIASYAWDPEGDGTFADESPLPAFSAEYPVAGTYQAAVRVRDSEGLTATASVTVEVVGNERPALDIRRGYEAQPTGTGSSFLEDTAVTFAATAADADGNVKRIQLDLDGQPGFEVDGARGTHVFTEPGTAIVNVRATDDEGGVTDERLTLTITSPACEGDSDVVAVGRLRAHARGWKRTVLKAGQPDEVVTWTACQPPPPQYLSLAQQLAPADQFDLPNLADRPSVNGISFVAPESLQVVQAKGKAPRVVWAASRIDVAAPGGTRLRLVDGLSTGSWKLEDNALTNVATRDAVFGGLDVGPLNGNGTIPLPSADRSLIKFYPQLPEIFGGVSTKQAVSWTAGGTVGFRQAPLPDCFTADGAFLPGLDFVTGDSGLKICRSATDPDAFGFTVDVDLASFTGADFGLPKIATTGAINDGRFAGLAADVPFPSPGISVFGPIFLKGIDFQLILEQNEFVKPGCVPNIGVDEVSLKKVRDAARELDVPEEVIAAMFPDYRVDYGTPSSALCGGADFYAGFGPIELAHGDISLGVAKYEDGRPDAFRILGRADILEVAEGKATMSVYSSGYAEMGADLHAEFIGLVSLDGHVLLQVGGQGFNAEAGLLGCIIPIDTCAGLRTLISSKGLGACLSLSVFGADWEPGAAQRWDEGITLYPWGCDLGDLKVHFGNGSTSTIVTPIPPDDRAAWTAGPRAATVALQKHEQEITVKPGLPGVYVGVRGQDDQLARFTLHGPKGETITVDGPAGPGQATRAKELLVGHDEAHGISHVFIGEPSPGTWTVTPDAGSVPIVEVVGADGIDKPDVKARVTGRGHRRVLRYRIAPRKGQVVRFREAGATGNQWLGTARGRRGRLRFQTAPGNAERREIVAVVEQDGLPRDEQTVARFSAPATQRAGRIARAKLRRRGTKVTLRWSAASGARRYRVRARLSDGRSLVRVVRRRRLTLSRVPRRATGTFTVAGIDAVDDAGPPKRAKLKAAKKKKR